jgi:hypothetical protein
MGLTLDNSPNLRNRSGRTAPKSGSAKSQPKDLTKLEKIGKLWFHQPVVSYLGDIERDIGLFEVRDDLTMALTANQSGAAVSFFCHKRG